MLRKIWLGGLATFVLVGFVVGCGSTSLVKKKQPRDPLLVTKKPITGGFHDETGAASYVIPQPPPVPEYDRSEIPSPRKIR